MDIRTIKTASLHNKRVILRVDFNVPIKQGQVMDITRIRESLATIKYLLKNKCSIVIISHLGRPDGQINPTYSLHPVAKKLQWLLHKKINFITEPLDKKIVEKCQQLKPGKIIMLENIRFYPGEEKNDTNFAKALSTLGDLYINDAFACSHRAHASIHAITKFLPSYAGLLLENEIQKLSLLFDELQHPVSFIIGGAKIEDKIELIKSFANKVDHFLFGGGIANTFLGSRGWKMGKSLQQKNLYPIAQEIATAIRRKRKNIHYPTDLLLADKLSHFTAVKNSSSHLIPNNLAAYDIGKKTTKQFREIIAKSRTIIWNGPLGVIEYRPFRHGTKKIVQAIVRAHQHGATTIIGGGDTLEALKILGISHRNFTHVSTGGGAMLEFLEKGTLPGIEVLIDTDKAKTK